MPATHNRLTRELVPSTLPAEEILHRQQDSHGANFEVYAYAGTQSSVFPVFQRRTASIGEAEELARDLLEERGWKWVEAVDADSGARLVFRPAVRQESLI